MKNMKAPSSTHWLVQASNEVFPFHPRSLKGIFISGPGHSKSSFGLSWTPIENAISSKTLAGSIKSYGRFELVLTYNPLDPLKTTSTTPIWHLLEGIEKIMAAPNLFHLAQEVHFDPYSFGDDQFPRYLEETRLKVSFMQNMNSKGGIIYISNLDLLQL